MNKLSTNLTFSIPCEVKPTRAQLVRMEHVAMTSRITIQVPMSAARFGAGRCVVCFVCACMCVRVRAVCALVCPRACVRACDVCACVQRNGVRMGGVWARICVHVVYVRV